MQSATNRANAGTPIVRIEHVGKIFRADEREIVALKDITLDIYQGEFICILGPSGCGKSTLLNAIAGFALPSFGRMIANNREVSSPGPDRAMVFQEYALFPWMTVAENVAFGLVIKRITKDAIRSKVDSLLEKLQLADFRDRFPKELSGGMRQRVAIARALALDSPMLLMDEPFGALDALTRNSLQDEVLRIWMEFKKTIIFVTHSIQESIYLANRVVVMTYRPGMVKKIVEVNIPHPRDISSPWFISLQQELTQMVMEEQMRSQKAETIKALA
ncbi:MAG TPA: ABC transporter ATP-binding protein [Nitrospirota bacterium]|nr:ABC transporter ATP-binding protein [Nitrospirota bacterium]